MRKTHLMTGLAFLVIFALTGRYMLNIFELAGSEFTTQRMMYRASHIYLLFVGAINALLGCYWVRLAERYARLMQNVASLAILVAQPVLLLAFIQEPPAMDSERFLTLVGCVLLLSGVILTLAAKLVSGGLIRKKITIPVENENE